MTNKDYHAHSAISKSDIDLFLKSPKLFWLKKNGELESSENQALLLGSVTHKLVLETNDFDSEFIIAPKADKRTKAGKEIWEEFSQKCQNDSRTIVPFDIYEQGANMAKAVVGDKVARTFLVNGKAEQSYFSTYKGQEIKCRPDYYNEEQGLIVDLKTTTSASEFAKSVGNFNYHLQVAMYSDILSANGLAAKGFLFIVVEKTAPYIVGFYELSENAVSFGRECYQNALDKIIALKANNMEFPACAELSLDENGKIEQKIIQEIDLPAWVYSKGA